MIHPQLIVKLRYSIFFINFYMITKDGNEPPPSRAIATSNEGGDSIASLVITTFQILEICNLWPGIEPGPLRRVVKCLNH